jgi:hypothetical protein
MTFSRWLVFGLVLSCSSDPETTGDTAPRSVTQTVGPDGGVITVEGATVTIPKGSLANGVDVTITASDDPPPDGFIALSRVIKCEPSGTVFAQPVTMKMKFVADGLASTMFWSTGGDPTFKDVGGVATNGTMSATVTHFSSGFVGRAKN